MKSLLSKKFGNSNNGNDNANGNPNGGNPANGAPNGANNGPSMASTAMNIAQDDEFKGYAAEAAQKQEVKDAASSLRKDQGVKSGLKTMFIGQITGDDEKIQQGQQAAFKAAANNQGARDAAKELAKDKEFRDKTFKVMKNQYKKNEDAIKSHAKSGAALGWKGAKAGFSMYMASSANNNNNTAKK